MENVKYCTFDPNLPYSCRRAKWNDLKASIIQESDANSEMASWQHKAYRNEHADEQHEHTDKAKIIIVHVRAGKAIY